MSRSRRPQCSVGRGCRCCGHAGAARIAREEDAAKADERELPAVLAGMEDDSREWATIAGQPILASFEIVDGRVTQFPVWLDGPLSQAWPPRPRIGPVEVDVSTETI